VHADGTTSKSGGRVVKNVSGYDLHKLYVGSLGTLAVIAEATFKVAPLPKAEQTVAVSCEGVAEAAGVIRSAHESGLAVIAAELLSPPAASELCGTAAWTALLRVGGGPAAVRRTLGDLGEYAGLARGSIEDVPDDVWTRWRAMFAPRSLSLRVSVMPSRAPDVAEVLDRRFAGDAAGISSTMTAGVVRILIAPEDDERALAMIEATREIAARYGGFAVVDAASPGVKRGIDVFGETRDDIAIMRRLKQEFDPAGILAPGRLVGRI
jgi:glycolate oxidase FAD binding subunit